MGKRDQDGKPRGRMSSYAFFVQTCREEHKKKHPDDQVVFTEFTKKCAEKWKEMTPKEKKRFEDMADRDKSRYENEMANYVTVTGQTKKSRRRTKDPNAPKRALSAFFFFCADERAGVKAENPGIAVSEVAKELGKKWEKCTCKHKYEHQAADDKGRYEREMTAYRSGGVEAVLSLNRAVQAKKAKVEEDEEDDDDEEEDDE